MSLEAKIYRLAFKVIVPWYAFDSLTDSLGHLDLLAQPSNFPRTLSSNP